MFHSIKTAVNLTVNVGTSFFSEECCHFKVIFSVNSQHLIRRPDPQNNASSVPLLAKVSKVSKELKKLVKELCSLFLAGLSSWKTAA